MLYAITCHDLFTFNSNIQWIRFCTTNGCLYGKCLTKCFSLFGFKKSVGFHSLIMWPVMARWFLIKKAAMLPDFTQTMHTSSERCCLIVITFTLDTRGNYTRSNAVTVSRYSIRLFLQAYTNDLWFDYQYCDDIAVGRGGGGVHCWDDCVDSIYIMFVCFIT